MDKKYAVSGRIGILDADLMDGGTRHPNLALMKLAGYYRDLGNKVKLIYKDYNEIDNFDHVFISKVFDFTSIPDEIIQKKNVSIGGTGFFPDGGENLPDEIERYMPYYDIYREFVQEQLDAGKSRSNYADYLDYSIGFTTRGCYRKCSFCVNKKYEHAFRHSKVSEFLDESRPYIYLWDDNVLAFPGWRSVLEEIAAIGKPFQFRQGIDLRLMSDEKAKLLNSVLYHGDFIFAFDHIKDRKDIIEKIQLWKRYCSKIGKLYVICGYDSQDEKDIEIVFERIAILMKYGSIPYIMRHKNYLKSEYKDLYIQIARWCNQPRFFKKMSFREFCIANQNYKKLQGTDCAALTAMKRFEMDHPQISKKYFDLKFEEQNAYLDQYGYGRKYSNKLLCSECKKKGLCWSDLFFDENKLRLLNMYYNREIDLECLHYPISDCLSMKDQYVVKFVEHICKLSLEEIAYNIDIYDEIQEVVCLSDMISYMEKIIDNLQLVDGAEGLKKIILSINENLTDTQLLKTTTDLCKILCEVDLCKYRQQSGINDLRLSNLGQYMLQLPVQKRKMVLNRTLLRLPLVQKYLQQNKGSSFLNFNLKPFKMTLKEKKEMQKILDYIKRTEECEC